MTYEEAVMVMKTLGKEVDKEKAKLYSCTIRPSSKYRDILSLFTGLRVGEVCGLMWSDIDFERNILKTELKAREVLSKHI